MPNWCENELTITTDTAELMDKILSEIKGENDEFSFEAFLPMPNILRAVVSPPRTGPNGRYMLQKDGGGFEHIVRGVEHDTGRLE